MDEQLAVEELLPVLGKLLVIQAFDWLMVRRDKVLVVREGITVTDFAAFFFQSPSKENMCECATTRGGVYVYFYEQ